MSGRVGHSFSLQSQRQVNSLRRYRPALDPEHLATLQVADTWITHITFAKWKRNDTDPVGYRCASYYSLNPPYHLIHDIDEIEEYLAYSTSHGAIGLVKVMQELHEIKEDTATFTRRYEIVLRVECVEEDLFSAEQAGPGRPH